MEFLRIVFYLPLNQMAFLPRVQHSFGHEAVEDFSEEKKY